jgi:hypothetical protein
MMDKITTMLTALGLIALGWTALGGAFLGYGDMLLRRAGVRRPLPRRAWDAFWLGQAFLLALALAVNLIAPLNPWVSLALLLPGWLLALAGIARDRHAIVRLGGTLGRARPWLCLLMLVIILWLMDLAIGPALVHETMIYHLNAVRWANAYPVVPGLANLQHNLGFNNATPLLAALVDHHVLDLRSPHILISLLWLPLTLRCVWGWSQVLRRARHGQRVTLENLWHALLLLPIVSVIFRPEFTSLAADPHAAAILAVTLGLLLRLTPGPRAGSSSRSGGRWLTLAALSAAALTVKLSMLPLTVLAPLTAAVLLHRPNPLRRWATVTRAAGVLLITMTLLLLPWLARSVILSGYPLFPGAALALDVPWRVPLENVRELQEWITVFARGARNDAQAAAFVHGWSWLPVWLRTTMSMQADRFLGSLLALGLLACVTNTLAPQRRPGEEYPSAWAWLILLPIVALVGLWMWAAPDLRLGFLTVWALPILPLTLLLPRWWRRGGSHRALRTMSLIGIVSVALPLAVAGRTAWGDFNDSGRAKLGALLWPLIHLPGPDSGLYPPTPGHFTRFTTRHGLVLTIPSDSAQGIWLWNAPLLGTHVPNPDLRLRDPHDLAAGFVVDPGPGKITKD